MSVRYREVAPDPRLAPYLRCLWYMERDYQGVADPETVWPDGKAELLCTAGAGYQGPEGPLPATFVIGPLTRNLPLRSDGRVVLVGARFHPWGFAPLWDGPVAELRDRILPFDGPALTGDDLDAGVARLQVYLLDRLAGREVHPAAEAAARAIVQSAGAVTMPELETMTGVTLRQLERIFGRWIGLSPKKLAMVCRFDAARKGIFRNPDTDLLDLAFHLGYYDYPHFAKDFQKCFGLTPIDFREFVLRQRAAFQRRTDVVFLQERPK